MGPGPRRTPRGAPLLAASSRKANERSQARVVFSGPVQAVSHPIASYVPVPALVRAPALSYLPAAHAGTVHVAHAGTIVLPVVPAVRGAANAGMPVAPVVHVALPGPVPVAGECDAGAAVSAVDVEPWLQAAREFRLNRDFDIRSDVRALPMDDLPSLMAVMKQASARRWTIQALADKILLHRMLENLDVPQLPALLTVEGRVDRHAVARFVDKCLIDPDAPDVVVKPTHLSNGTGVSIMSRVMSQDRREAITFLVSHMQHFMAQSAGVHESLALQSLSPGFLVQPRYQSVVEFQAPLELRVVALWGKVRVGAWWWGRNQSTPGEAPQRNTWIVRCPARADVLGDDDTWETVHEHRGVNAGFDRAIELFERHMPAMAATTEAIAHAVGTPFLRADFFVGSSEWGVVLNEVAYGCGVDYRRRSGEGAGCLVDDAPAIARILREGMEACRTVLPPKHFLSKLGVQGTCYANTFVSPILKMPWRRLLPSRQLRGGGDENAEECAVSEDLCKTKCHQKRHSRRGKSCDARVCVGPCFEVSQMRWAVVPGVLMPKTLPNTVVVGHAHQTGLRF